VLECEPINAEALALQRSIPKELEAQALAQRAKEFVELGRDEQALEQIERSRSSASARRCSPRSLRGGEAGEDRLRRVHEGREEGAREAGCTEHARLDAKLQPPKPTTPQGPSLAERVLARLREPALAEPVLLYAPAATPRR